MRTTDISNLLKYHQSISLNGYFLASILDASLDGLGGGAADCVHAVCAVVLLVVQEPAGIRQASHLYPSVSQSLQQLCHTVHVQKDTGTTRTAHRNTICSN